MKIGYQLIFFAVVVATVTVGEGRTVVVGGPENWRYGFNYTDWAINNGPFYINDKLVFKYQHNSGYNVYLLPDLWSYLTCDFSRATLVGGPTQGSGRHGFAFDLDQWRLHYFASGGSNAQANCKEGMMKFFVMPWPRWF